MRSSSARKRSVYDGHIDSITRETSLNFDKVSPTEFVHRLQTGGSLRVSWASSELTLTTENPNGVKATTRAHESLPVEDLIHIVKTKIALLTRPVV